MATNTDAEIDRSIRAVLTVATPGNCPVARSSAAMDTSISTIERSHPTEDGAVIEDFTVDDELPGELPDTDVRELFRTGGERRYRFKRDKTTPCVCESVESFGLPISDVRAKNGSLVLTFYVPEVGRVKAIVQELRERFGAVSISHLSHSGADTDGDLVLVDRASLTARQREVIETAYELGYFSHPKGANAGDVAEALDISRSTFAEHLSAAQTKLLSAVLKH
ncbi:helix-turn-helix domain-containing protein [Haladaptatus sp. NG-SE-30]